MVEYESVFGARVETVAVQATSGSAGAEIAITGPGTFFRMYYTLQLYFANGGGSCYIVSIGPDDGSETITDAAHVAGLNAIAREDEPTLLVFPDAEGIQDAEKLYGVYQQALAQCESLKDRFMICDIFNGQLDFRKPGGPDVINDPATDRKSVVLGKTGTVSVDL